MNSKRLKRFILPLTLTVFFVSGFDFIDETVAEVTLKTTGRFFCQAMQVLLVGITSW